jgi:hypothetical protein
MKPAAKEQETVAMWGLYAIAFLLLAIATFLDPIGTSPDSGVFDLGVTGTKWLLGGLGWGFLVGGLWSSFKRKAPHA